MNKYLIAIVGATGLVGETLIKLFEENNAEGYEIHLYASERSANKKIAFKNNQLIIRSLNDSLDYIYDFVFFMTDKEITLKYIDKFKNSTYIIDNSSAFRLNNEVPLVVPEINFNTITKRGIISNPNCTTAICAIPIHLISSKFGIKRINTTTFQAVSGAGKFGVKALYDSLISQEIFKVNINETCLPKIGNISHNLYTEEECKFIYEMRKILCDYDLQISATCVRVPIKNCHGAALSITLKNRCSIDEIKAVLKANNQVVCLDDEPPTALLSNNCNKIYLGRLRWDLSLENTLLCFVYGDNLRRGAAYNAYRIMEYLKNDSV